MLSPKFFLVVPTFVLATACSPATSTMNTSADSGTPATTADAAATGALSCTLPTLGNQCATEGCDLRPFTLPSCTDGAADVNFYDQSFCEAKATVLIVSAEWCVPCQMEATHLKTNLIDVYAGMGLRVISVIAQNADTSAPTASHCRNWRSSYHVPDEVTMAIDPLGATQIYFPGMAFPANLVIDRHGKIVYRQYGTGGTDGDLHDAIDGALAN